MFRRHQAGLIWIFGSALLSTEGKCETIEIAARDTTKSLVNLDSAVVSTYSDLLSPEQIGAARWVTDSTMNSGFGSDDISNALNSIPGVLMETRGMGGSRRINVRGSALRSPFGVRNTMLYLRGFVLTEADGTSPVEWLEPAWSGPMEMITGAAATTYGGAYGGALVARGAEFPEGMQYQRQIGTTGNTGTQGRLNVVLGGQNWNVRGNHSWNDGYRDHEWNQRWHLEANFRRVSRGNHVHQDWLAAQDGSWALPGAIKEDSDPLESPGKIYNAHVRRRRAHWGHHVHLPEIEVFKRRSTLDVWTLLRWTDKVNPYGTSPFYNGYKEESGLGGSFRIRQRFAPMTVGKVRMQAEWTAIGIADNNEVAEWSSAIEGVNSPLRYDLDLEQWRSQVAPSVAWAWDNGFRLETACALTYRARRAYGVANNATYDSPFQTGNVLPRIGLSLPVGDQWTMFAQLSSGFSDPTNFESLSTDGAGELPLPLAPELAWNGELGIRNQLLEGVIYHQTLRNAIVQVVDSLGATTFINSAGPVTMRGIEMMTQHSWNHHQLIASGSAQFHRWGELALPGSPPWTATLLHRWDLPVGHRSWNLQTWIRAVGATPLDSENSVDHPAYGTIHLQLNWDSSTEMQWSCGIRNVNNTAYSGWHQLNGVYGKYYNPAPPRTFWVGITWRAF